MYPRDLLLAGYDGVVVDRAAIRSRCWAEALAEIGFERDQRWLMTRFDGVSDRSVARSVTSELGRALPTGFEDGLTARFKTGDERELRPVPGVEAALRRLGLPVCVVSGANRAVTRHGLEVAGLWSRVTPHLFLAEEVEHGPPAGDLFQHAAAEMGVPASRCVVVEASVHGVRGGKAAGMTVFGFAGSSHVLADVQAGKLRAAGADIVFDRMAELPRLFSARAA
ncbi:MAG: HAD-IA family hydrolase [Pseudomonadota bacterium]